MEHQDGTYTTSYCHYDGYLDHNGKILVTYYNERQKVEELLSFGDMSALAERVTPDPETIHTFDESQKNVCVFYGRDRGEKNTQAKNYLISELLKNVDESWIEFCYIFTLNNEWKYFNQYDSNLRDVKEVLKKRESL
ncbi:MAG: hypothetical protein FWE36_08460 [Erysipelotrichales bacterium]|nr:hypothetical protein [Erysipelotrichales bacterium]